MKLVLACTYLLHLWFSVAGIAKQFPFKLCIFQCKVSEETKVHAVTDKVPTVATKSHFTHLFVLWDLIRSWATEDFPDYESTCISFCKLHVQTDNLMFFWACICPKLFIKKLINFCLGGVSIILRKKEIELVYLQGRHRNGLILFICL